MKTVEDVLTPEEILRYRKGWTDFGAKYVLNSEQCTHSGKPVISQVYRFGDKPLFRAHIFNKRLRKIDPYFISKKYIIPFWHIAHYLTVLEQMYHASIQEIRETERFITKDVPREFNLSKPIFWDDNISVELILEPKRQKERYSIEDCFCSLYDNKTNKVKGRISVRTFVEPRAYIKGIADFKQGDNQVLGRLIRKIEMQDVNQRRLIKPRKSLQCTKDYLISQLGIGKIPEEELHDFFSLWDKPHSNQNP